MSHVVSRAGRASRGGGLLCGGTCAVFLVLGVPYPPAGIGFLQPLIRLIADCRIMSLSRSLTAEIGTDRHCSRREPRKLLLELETTCFSNLMRVGC